MGPCWPRAEGGCARGPQGLWWWTAPPLLFFYLESMICTCSCLQVFSIFNYNFHTGCDRISHLLFPHCFPSTMPLHITYSGNFCNIELDLFYFCSLYIKCTKLNRIHIGNDFIFSQPSFPNIFGQISLPCIFVSSLRDPMPSQSLSVLGKVRFA